ncbi:MAG: 3-deoxy-D-manno-octulosonic acid transferase [Caulobacteraceae bacterium]|nr:3-deoxy-D-manno-octulosonic acid transferase [Caulobacteraceae bacterium]
MSAALKFYRGLTGLAEPLAPLLLDMRARQGKEDFGRLNERLGRPAAPRPAGPLIWLHGVSVGESLSLLPLVERMRLERRDANLLVTSGTVTSAELLARRLPPSVIHQFAPVDAPRATRGFLDHWRPDVGVLVESELWPNLILGAAGRGVRMALVSARITERTARNWSRTPRSARRLLDAFSLILAQDADSAARLESLGRVPDGRLNLKYAGDPLPFDARALTAARKAAGGRPVLLAASTHDGEEEMVLEAYQRLDTDRRGSPLLVIVPRHRERGPAVAALSRAIGFSTGRFGEGDRLSAECDVYVADSLGELGLWFRLAHTAFLGGSLRPGIGGHNPLEAVQVGAPVISGAHVSNWTAVYADLAEAGLARMLEAPADLAGAWEASLDANTPREAIRKRADAIQKARSLEVEAAVSALTGLLP